MGEVLRGSGVIGELKGFGGVWRAGTKLWMFVPMRWVLDPAVFQRRWVGLGVVFRASACISVWGGQAFGKFGQDLSFGNGDMYEVSSIGAHGTA